MAAASPRRWPTEGLSLLRQGWRNIVELDEVDVPTLAVLRHLEQVDHAVESRAARQLAGDVVEGNGQDRLHQYMPAFHRIDAADPDMRLRPDPHAAGDSALA